MPQENSDFVTRTEKVLALERKTEYQDQATTCGLETFIRRQNPAWASHVTGYARATAAQREAMISKLETAMKDNPRVPSSPGLRLSDSIAEAKGVGAKRASLLNRLGVETLEDLLLLLPRRLEDRTHFTPIGSLHDGMETCVRGTVQSIRSHMTRRRLTLITASVGDGTGFLHVVWFNQPWILDQVRSGMNLDLFGRVEHNRGQIQMNSPVWEFQGEAKEIGRWVPVYPATEGISARTIRSLVQQNLPHDVHSMSDALPSEIRERFGLLPRWEAVQTLHNPSDDVAFEQARKSLAFEEFYLLQLGLLASVRSEDGRIHRPHRGLMESYVGSLPFKLTRAQRIAIEEIRSDLSQPRRMMRLLQGDVGSGKTLVALAAALTGVDSGCQVAYMAPTEILAEQHGHLFQRELSGLPVEVALLTGSRRGKNEVQQRIASGEVDFVIGTHALIQETVAFHDLGLIIIDEQHRFGVVQRSAIEEKGHQADLLVMSATPIPRTITLTLYGQFDVSTLDEMPAGPRDVSTRWVPASRRESLYAEVASLLERGGKGYVVLPLVEESEKIDAGAAVQVAEELAQRFPQYGVQLVHGRLSSEEKAAAMSAFREGGARILVCTTVIEVGIDVQDADFMVIEDADRFGLSQLHQLRGRIGRAGQPAWCYALARAATDDAKDRLAAFEQHVDGFSIAEEDLRIRGPGDVVGTQQHGYFTLLRAVNLVQDLPLLRRAREAAKETYAKGVSDDLTRLVEQRLGDMLRWVRV